MARARSKSDADETSKKRRPAAREEEKPKKRPVKKAAEDERAELEELKPSNEAPEERQPDRQSLTSMLQGTEGEQPTQNQEAVVVTIPRLLKQDERVENEQKERVCGHRRQPSRQTVDQPPV